MVKTWSFFKEHGAAVTAVLAVLAVVVYAGSMHQRVASAEDDLRTIQDQVIRADKTAEDRVVRIYDKLDGFSQKLDAFTKEQRDHLLADANQYREISVNIQSVADDLKAIREDLKHRKR